MYVCHYDDLARVLVQIQATIETLTIAVLALLSGRIADSYMGVSVVNYVLNKKPWIFKQWMIISVSVILLVGSVFLDMFLYYNMVVALFIVDCVFILISVHDIFKLFTGNTNVEQEIGRHLSLNVEEEV